MNKGHEQPGKTADHPSKATQKSLGLRSLIKDSLLYVPSKAVPAVMGFASVVMFTRLLSPEEYGWYVLTITTVAIVSLIGFGWLNQSALRFFEESRKKNNIGFFP